MLRDLAGRFLPGRRCLPLGFFLVGACIGVEEVAVEDLPVYLAPVAGASDISARRGMGGIGVSYRLEVAYPADRVLEEIRTRFPADWTPRQEDSQNPGIPTSHVRGWTNYRDLTTDPDSWVHQWSAEWENPEGDIASFSLLYRSMGPFDQGSVIEEPSNTAVRVYSGVTPSDLVAEYKVALDARRDVWERQQVESGWERTGRGTFSKRVWCRALVESDALRLRQVSPRTEPPRTETAECDGDVYYYDAGEILLGTGHFCRDGISIMTRTPTDGSPSERAGLIVQLSEEGAARLKEWRIDHGEELVGVFWNDELLTALNLPATNFETFIPIPLDSEEEAELLRAQLVGEDPVEDLLAVE